MVDSSPPAPLTSNGIQNQDTSHMDDDPEPRPMVRDDSTADSITRSISGQDKNPSVKKSGRGFQFWAIIISLCVTGILPGLESTVVTTSLPVIVRDLSLGDNYIWVTNIFFLTSAAFQPLFGQLANIFGRRWLALSIVAIYTFGSGICGGAVNGAMLIVGRGIQGIGSGGLNMIVDVIVSDLVPLRERGNFIAIILTVYSIGTTIGPFVGGIIVQNTTWRWVFYLNIPVGGASMAMLFAFLHVKSRKEMTFLQKMKRIDYIGNAMIMASSVSVLYALTYGGSRYPWGSWRIVVPLVLGLVGMALFYLFENSRFVIEPVTPPRLFKNRTSATVFVITFLNSVLLYWALFFLPVYFQAVLLSSSSRTGVDLLPVVLVAVPAAVVAVIILTKYGRYRPLHHIGFAFVTIGLGLFTLLDANSSTAEWVIFQMIAGGGSGFVLNTLLPACQAALPESDQAASTATWAFVRSFGSIWGVAIPAAIFNSRFQTLSPRISDPTARATLSAGQAYEHATVGFVKSFQGTLRSEIIGVYSDTLKTVWQVAIAFSGVAFFLVFIEKEIVLRTELETEFGLEKEEEKKKMENQVSSDAEYSSVTGNQGAEKPPVTKEPEKETPPGSVA